jgi:hypothetical protein|uniref:Glycosyl transferase family 1 domain-containing protein n=1 Tax=viral metagenome TaxID=1070528 RepID=A0A6C0EE64_9ZZZZ
MKIALYHGFTDIHFEMLGYFLEYIKYTKININIYAFSENDHGKQWKEYYVNLFDINIKWTDPTIFNPYNYDLIILLTDDDKTFKDDWLEEFGQKKVICIDHCGLIRRNNMMLRIGTRFFNRRPNTLWALPCYYGINKFNKIKILEENTKIQPLSKIKILCIGIQNRPPCIEFLTDLFENFDDLEFHIIARFFNVNYDSYKNIFTYQLCPTNIMFDLVKKSNYILCLDNPLNDFPIANSISGAIPISFSYGCQLIIPSTWNKFYNFKSAIVYNDNYLQKNGQTKLNLSNNIDLDKIYSELYELVAHRNVVFDNFLKNKLENNKNSLNWQIQILNMIEFPIPNIIINYNLKENINEIIHNFKLEFREIHLINCNIEINENYIYSYNQINNILKINESIMLNINNEYSDLVYEEIIKIISIRNYKDVIIINNSCDINKILSIYNRHSIYYNYENKIIIIPQR